MWCYQKENESLVMKLSSDKDFIQLQKLQQQNSQLRVDCDKAKKVWYALYIITVLIISVTQSCQDRLVVQFTMISLTHHNNVWHPESLYGMSWLQPTSKVKLLSTPTVCLFVCLFLCLYVFSAAHLKNEWSQSVQTGKGKDLGITHSHGSARVL